MMSTVTKQPVWDVSAPLSPAQTKAVATQIKPYIGKGLPGKIVELTTDGRGSSTILRFLSKELKVPVMDSAVMFMEQLSSTSEVSPCTILASVVADVITRHFDQTRDQVLLLDNFGSLFPLKSYWNPNQHMWKVATVAIKSFLETRGLQLVVASRQGLFWGSHRVEIELTEADYGYILEKHLGRLDHINVVDVHRSFKSIGFFQLIQAASILKGGKGGEPVTTQAVCKFLEERGVNSNVNLDLVEKVDVASLRGLDGLLEQLEAHVVIPLTNHELSEKLGLQPKKGVLLYGPPGTGKTSIGRMLAHLLKGKFLMIDGKFSTLDRGKFYQKIDMIFKVATDNAPSIIFIDDADTMWEKGQNSGLYRYLLTKMDGLNNKPKANVCIILTAMDLKNIPNALVRSGRCELWLETKRPSRNVRAQIIDDLARTVPLVEGLRGFDKDLLADKSDGFCCADFRRVFQDAVNGIGCDLIEGKPSRTATEYMMEAVGIVRSNNAKRQEVEKAARLLGN